MILKKSKCLWAIVLISPFLLISSVAFASHNFGGLDMCALYPEVMPPGLPAEQLPDKNSPAAQLMQTYCTQCHELPGPGRHTTSEWPLVLDRMMTLMDVANRFGGLLGNIKNPTTDEHAQLQQYLTQYALKPLQHKPDGMGARAFENHCSACHALPDPLQYKNTNWPELIKRMQRNMTVMQYTPPSSEVMLQIQHYLQLANALNSHPLKITDTSSVAEQNQKNKSSSIHLESWLALGPFLLLVVVGLVRWWISSHKKNNRQMQA